MKLQVLLQVIMFILLAGSTSLLAQPEIDSLLSQLKITPAGQGKIDLYEKIGCYYMNVEVQDFVRAKSYTDSIKLLSEKLHSRKGHFQALYAYGLLAYQQGNYAQAQENLQAVIDYSKAQGDSVRLGEGLYHMAVVDMNLGKYDKSLATLYLLMENEEKESDPRKVGMLLNMIGIIHDRTNKFNEAVDAYIQAGDMFKKANLPVRYGMSLQNMANIYLAQKKYGQAAKAYKEALRIFEVARLPVLVAIVLGNLGRLYVAQNEHGQALGYHQRALVVWRQHSRKQSLANCLKNLGNTSLKLKQYAQASTYLNEALQLAQEIKADLLLYDVYSAIQALHLEQDDYKQAYHFYSLANQMKDSLFTESKIKEVNELQAKYETEKKDKQIALLAKEKAIQAQETQRQATFKKASIGGGILISLLAILSFYVFQQRLKNQKLLTSKNDEIKEATFKRQLSELEIKALRAQINPHFLFNCLNSINRMVLDGETDTASVYLSKFSKLVRLILENTETTTVTLENELALLESYIQLEELRFKGKISYSIGVDKSIEKESTYLPSMVLQPFVENAIWHGLLHKDATEKGAISITVREADEQLLCTIEDNGVGREKAAQLREKSVLKSKSMGIKITEERLRLLNPKRLEELIRITDLKDALNHTSGTRVEINIPIL
ncbi:tetratricopeptide repeat protein [Rhodocytophaga rosea]|uniref:Tetratricopeptide repeat protein n=1 Tax=Rhodocytophaga rosea TaxID=2704465 RepID=A0A6C0GLD8_9BACT|nr:tetratricopeptide repeat protein [Rhodocytophaga rosea]QHT68799.1 tetratricopeptide repeat protein [Rhodocytophaga rosea]